MSHTIDKVENSLTARNILEYIQDFSLELASTADKEKLYRLCLSQTKEILQLDFSSLLLLSKSGTKLVVRATDGFPDEMVNTFILREGQGLPSYVLQTKKVETVVDFFREDRFEVSPLMAEIGIRSAIAVPMMISKKVFGVLIGHSNRERVFSDEEKLLYQVLANHAAVAIKNVMYVSSIDKSEKKREKKIEELQHEREISQARTDEFESIFSNMMTGVMLLKGGRYLARCNKKFADIFGYSSVDEIVGMSARNIHLSEAHYRKFGRKYYGNLVAGEIVEAEYALRKKDGTPVLCRLSGRSVDQSYPPDLKKGFVWVIDDISRRKEMEDEVLKARKLESIGILAGGIGHDFNNLLSAILGNIGLAQRLLEPDHRIHDLLSSALEAGNKAKDLTAKLLFFTRRDSHKVGSVKLHELLEEVDFAKYLERVVEFRVEVQPDLFAIKIMPDHLKAILQNLLLNANSFLGEGGVVNLRGQNIELMDGKIPGLSAGKYVEIVVEDNGSGIGVDILDNIFDPYFTTQSRDSSKGIGLGLAIVHSIVMKNHGGISVKSTKEKGTAFTVTLPAAIHDILCFER